MSPGESVSHPDLGNGKLLATQSRGGSVIAHVDFGYMREWVAASELRTPDGANLSDASEPATPSPGEAGVAPLSESVVAARGAVVALRLGQIHERDVLQLSVGTEGIQEQLEKLVQSAADRKPCSVLIQGGYGSGKTHLLTMLSAVAAKRGLALAAVLLDGEGTSLTEPNSLLSNILRSIVYPGEVAPVGLKHRFAQFAGAKLSDDVLRRAGKVGETIRAFSTDALAVPELTDVLEDYLSLQLAATHARQKVAQLGYRAYLPTVRAWTVAKRPARFCQLLTEWAEFATATGAKGLVVVFDELDVEYGLSVGRSQHMREMRRRRQELLRGLHATFDRRRRVPLLVAFGSAPTADEIELESDPVRDVSRLLPRTKVIDALEPSARDLRELGRRLRLLHARAYGNDRSPDESGSLTDMINDFAERGLAEDLNPTPRRFVRGVLELLDVATHSGSARGGR